MIETLLGSSIAMYGWSYFLLYHLPKILPLLVFSLYCFADFKFKRLNRVITGFAWLALIGACVIGLVLVVGCVANLPLNLFIGDAYGWSYEAPIEWMLCFIGCWIITKSKTGDAIATLGYAVVAVSAGGDLHEFAFGLVNPNHYYHSSYPLFVSTQVLCILFLVLFMKWHNWKINKVAAVAFVVYLVFSMVYATVINPNVSGIWHLPNMLIQRLPAIFLVMSIPLGFRKEQNAKV